MPQKLDVFNKEHTFVGIELQDDISQMLYHMYMLKMGFPWDTMDIKVIYKDLKELLQPFKENICHCL